MNLSTLDRALWAAGFVGQISLLAILVVRRRWRDFPVFSSLMGFECAMAALLYWVHESAPAIWYAPVYWTYATLDFVLQISVVVEIARVVLHPTRTWVRDARKSFLLSAAAGLIIAAGLAWIVSPPSHGVLERLEVRGNLFTSLMTCELFVIMSLTANRLGLAWRSHVMAIAQGLTAWSATAVLIDALHSYYGFRRDFITLEHVRMVMYLAAIAYWMVQLWRNEPTRKPLSPELSEYIVALNQRVQYDLRHTKLGS